MRTFPTPPASLVGDPSRPADGAPAPSPEDSGLFSRWTNPSNGVVSLVLSTRIAPVQQSFYYTHPSFSDDGRFLWLRVGHPPRGGSHSVQTLAVADLLTGELRAYPETQFPAESVMVDPRSAEVYWTNRFDVWKRGPFADDLAVRVGGFPEELGEGRLALLATHPTFSADRRSLNIDARFIRGDGSPVCFIGELPLDGSPFELWQKVEGRYFDHGLFSPVDRNLQLIAHEFWQDAGRAGHAWDGCKPYHRIWLLRRGGEMEPLLKAPVSHSGHEWWSADGRRVYYVHYGVGVKSVDLATREDAMVWPGHLSHAHCDRTGRYFVADRMDEPGNPDCHVIFRDSVTGKTVGIVNRGPLAANLTRCTHLHPHPQFCLGDRYICYTTTVHDRVDVALAPVADLIARTA